MADSTIFYRTVPTRLGDAEARLVDTWIGVAASGDLLIRDVWEITISVDDLQLQSRVLTFPDPTNAQLAIAVMDQVAKAMA